jgi:DNA-binding response OmpR family regulator
LAKPFSESQLLARVARLMRAKRQADGKWVLV